MTISIYQRLFEGWPEPRLLVDKNSAGLYCVHKCNRAGSHYFSQSEQSLEGQVIEKLIDAGSYAHVLRAFEVCWSSKMPVSVQLIPAVKGEIRLRSFFFNPLMDGEKVVAIDVAARLPAIDDENLRRERDDAMSIFASVFDASDVGILVTDHHRRIVRVNDTFCKTFGWQPIDLVGFEFTKLIPESEHDVARKRHDDFMGNMFVEKSRELKIKRGDETLANVIATSGIIELSGNRKFRISTVVDISYLKKIEKDLRKSKEIADAASHAKSTFLANMSHELRTPLNAIIGFSDLMIAGTLGQIENKNYREYLGDIKFSALHLLDIINDVLDMSKIEAGQMKIFPQRTDVEPIVDEAVRLMRARATEAGVMLKTEIASGLPAVNIDQRMIRQVLLNLLSNAVKFSTGRGSVMVKAGRDAEGFVSISVIDQGIGIPEEKLSDVMLPFGQVQDPRVNAGQGTGLGLPLARTMVELHGGSLNISSKLDVGTTVSFTLPPA
ncbi:MAG: PAS domain S-box protein [Proteobacteria bacterium]|nr:PAS domain S-box protein [Pseudomonadota bacterium]